MAYGLMGNPAINRPGGNLNNDTVIDKLIPATARGILKEVQIYMISNDNVKIKVFRDDGTNYVFIGESPLTAVLTGLNTIKCWIPIIKGDLLASYVTSSNRIEATTSGGNQSHKAGDVTTTSLKSGWTSASYQRSVEGKIFTRVSPLII